MQLSTVQTMSSPMNITNIYNHNPYNYTAMSLLPKPFIPSLRVKLNSLVVDSNKVAKNAVSASLMENPVIWGARICVFYALLKSGFAGSHSTSPLVSGSSGVLDVSDLGFSKWLDKLRNNPDKEAADKRKLVSKWHPTTKGTLRRNYRIPSKPEGRRLLKAIAALLSDDDHFVDASSHKGCQIRRESAHGESVCCNNVRALFDELPTPHLIVEITPFPAGPLSEKDYAKAEKLERVLRSSPSV
ncbi:hypothetical protein RND81_12G185000 [Saponaria officinalis]|uniref:Uncharacterized protein n=1 Tax=Saponaria officinalis TaxID=3572 RepID=A0AAW1HCF1_SAPOF